MKEEARQTAAREADLPVISHKTWQAENFEAPLLACPQTAALHLALCLSLSRVSLLTFTLTHAHLPAFCSHFLTAHNTGTLFLKFFL
jgi:hypothetical protein